MKRSAFTLVELVLAIFVLGIGMISVAALFPAGIAQQQASEDDTYGPLVAKQAFELLRSKLSQSDFGTFEEFSDPASTQVVRDPIPLQKVSANSVDSNTRVTNATTISGDWVWKRPGMILKDDASTNEIDEAGMLDIFSDLFTRLKSGRPDDPSQKPLDKTLSATDLLTEFPKGIPYMVAPRHLLFGIPYRRDKYDQQRDITLINYAWRVGGPKTDSPDVRPPQVTNTPRDVRNVVQEPGVFISQRDRYWPIPELTTGAIVPPKYVWDCMFRRYGGRVQAAVFVYRIGGSNGVRGASVKGTPYVVATAETMLLSDVTSPDLVKGRPAIPQWASSRTGSHANLFPGTNPFSRIPWGAGGLDGKVGKASTAAQIGPLLDDTSVPNTNPVGASSDTDKTALRFSDGWQASNQWLVDMYGNIHRVLRGRNNQTQGPVGLSKPVPRQPYGNVLIDLNDRDVSKPFPLPTDETGVLCSPGSGGDSKLGIQDLWFVPLEDANGNTLIPVFVSIEEL